jgi:hypothetical protein
MPRDSNSRNSAKGSRKKRWRWRVVGFDSGNSKPGDGTCARVALDPTLPTWIAINAPPLFVQEMSQQCWIFAGKGHRVSLAE